jgi:hypothetical protein
VTDVKNACVTDPLKDFVTHKVWSRYSEQNYAADIGDADASKQLLEKKKYYT